jgi:hypothetical protein
MNNSPERYPMSVDPSRKPKGSFHRVSIVCKYFNEFCRNSGSIRAFGFASVGFELQKSPLLYKLPFTRITVRVSTSF